MQADYHLQLMPGTNVAVINAMAHVIVTEGLVNEAYVRERCELGDFESWARFIADERHSPEALEKITGVPAADVRAAARLYATGGNGAIYYGLGVTEHSQGSTMVMGMANLAMATGNFGSLGVGVNPLRGQNNVQGSCDMGSFPHELPGYRHVADDATRHMFEALVGPGAFRRAGAAYPEHARRGGRRQLQGPLRAGRGHRPVRSRHASTSPPGLRRWNASSSRTSS